MHGPRCPPPDIPPPYPVGVPLDRRQARLDALARLHADHSAAHAAEAPPVPDRADGAVWNLDYTSPALPEAEFQAAAAEIFAR